MKRSLVNTYFLMALVCLIPLRAHAMHIGEGMLPASWSIAWGVVCLPFVLYGFRSIGKRVNATPKVKILLAMCGAFAFVLSALKIPSVTGSCSHPTGVGLAAILFGPTITSVLGLIVLVFQALLLAHGGLTTLGANTFSMAIAGPLVSWGIWRLCGFLRVNRRVSVFLAAALGDFFTYCVTSLQLALAHPSAAGGVPASAAEFLAVFAVTQIPLAIIEGLVTAAAVLALEQCAQPELRLLNSWNAGRDAR